MLRRMRRLIALLTVLACAAIATYGAVTATGSVDERTDRSRSTEGRSAATAAAELRVAVSGRGSVVPFQSESRLFDRVFQSTRGTYLAEQDSWTARTIIDDPTGETERMIMLTRSITDTVWMQMPGWPARMRGCWMELPRGSYPIGNVALGPGVPAYVAALEDLETTGFVGDSEEELTGSLAVQSALYLLPGQTIERMKVAKSSEARVPVRITLSNGRVAAYKMAGRDLVETMADAGDEQAADMKTFVEAMKITIKLPAASGRSPTIVPPAERLTVTAKERACR